MCPIFLLKLLLNINEKDPVPHNYPQAWTGENEWWVEAVRSTGRGWNRWGLRVVGWPGLSVDFSGWESVVGILEGGFTRWHVSSPMCRRLPGELCLETWWLRDEVTGGIRGSLVSKLLMDFTVGYVRLSKEAGLFVYQEEGSTHQAWHVVLWPCQKMRQTQQEWGPLPGWPMALAPLCSLGCRMLNWHPGLLLDLSEEGSNSIQVKIACPKQKAFKLFLGGKTRLRRKSFKDK